MDIPTDFSERIAESRARHLAPAIAAVWIGSDRRLSLAAHGDLPATTSPQWHIGSCTKAMTATVFGRLVDKGLINFDTPLATALPTIADTMSPAFQEMPLRSVLTHSAGIPANPAPSTFRALRRSTASVQAQREFLASEALKRAPDREQGYSNLGYIVVGAVIEAITGEAWETALSRDVMIPLSIARFGFGGSGRGDLAGHRRIRNTWQEDHRDNPEAYGPAGRVHLALDEWGRFLRAHTGKPSLLAAQTQTTLHTPAANGFAMGWIVRQFHGERCLIHTGSNTAWFAQATLLPDLGVGLGVVCNAFDPRIEEAVAILVQDLMRPAEITAP